MMCGPGRRGRDGRRLPDRVAAAVTANRWTALGGGRPAARELPVNAAQTPLASGFSQPPSLERASR